MVQAASTPSDVQNHGVENLLQKHLIPRHTALVLQPVLAVCGQEVSDLVGRETGLDVRVELTNDILRREQEGKSGVLCMSRCS